MRCRCGNTGENRPAWRRVCVQGHTRAETPRADNQPLPAQERSQHWGASTWGRWPCNRGMKSRRARCLHRGYPGCYHFVNINQFETSSRSAYRKILKISSISESPGKSGLRVHISAKIAPTDHISTPVEYWRPPKRISGERYHNVTTWSQISNATKNGILDAYLVGVCAEGDTKCSCQTEIG